MYPPAFLNLLFHLWMFPKQTDPPKNRNIQQPKETNPNNKNQLKTAQKKEKSGFSFQLEPNGGGSSINGGTHSSPRKKAIFIFHAL